MLFQGVEWLETQSNVLQEVDQLVELMTAEKAALNQRIARLKASSLVAKGLSAQLLCSRTDLFFFELLSGHPLYKGHVQNVPIAI